MSFGRDGSDLPALSADPDKASSNKAEGTLAAGEIVPEIAAALQKLPATPETLLLVGESLRGVGDYDGAAAALRKAITLAPGCGVLNAALSAVLADDGQTNEANYERDLALKANPRLIAAALDAFQEKSKSLPTAERIHQLNLLLAVNPASASVLRQLYSLYTEAKMTGKAFQSARAAYQSEPGIASLLRYMKVYSDNSRENEADALLQKGLKAYPLSDALLEEDASRLERGGDNAAAIADYRKVLLTSEFQSRTRRRIAELYRAEKQNKAALAAYQFLHEIRPQDSTYCSALADLRNEMGRKAEAIALYKEAIRLEPSRVELRDKLQTLTGEKPMLEMGNATPTAPILALAKTLKAGGSPAISLLDEGITVVYPDYVTVSRFHQIIKIFDEAGVKHFETVYGSRNSSSANVTFESARLIKANGKIETIAVSEYDSSVTFPSLAVGDVIDVTHRVEDYPTGGLGGHFWREWFFDEENVPSRLSRYVLIAPSDVAMQTQTHGAVPEPTVRQIKGWQIREWKRSDVPALPVVTLGTSRRDRGCWLDLSTFQNWSEIVRWYQDLSGPLCVPDAAVRSLALELTANAPTETDKIRALVAYAARKVQYQSGAFRLSAYIPTEGKQVLREHYGDCKDKSALLVALLAAVNIRADMVLISGREYGVTPYLPSPRFNHAITRIRAAQGDLWVDATADKMESGSLPYPDQEVPALVIAPETTGLTLSPADPIERTKAAMRLTTKLDAAGKLSGDFALEATGNMNWLIRSAFANVSADQHEQALRGIIAQLLPDAQFDGGRLPGLDNQDAPFRAEITFHDDHYASIAGNFLLARLPWNFKAAGLTLLADEKRRDGLEVASTRGVDIAEAVMELPAGYEAQDLKPEVKGQCPYESYIFTYRMEGNRLIARCEQQRRAFRIPVSDLKIYRDYMTALSQEGNRQWVLKKTN